MDLEKLFHDSEYQKQAAEARDRTLRLCEAKQLSELSSKYRDYLKLLTEYTKQNQGHLIGFFKHLDQRMKMNEISGIDEIYTKYTSESHQDFAEIAVELIGRYHLSNLLALMNAIAEERSEPKLHTQQNSEDTGRPTEHKGDNEFFNDLINFLSQLDIRITELEEKTNVGSIRKTIDKYLKLKGIDLSQ